MIQSAVFYVFAAVLVLSALMVVVARNPVHAVLFLILCFFNAAALFLLMGAEFVAMILIIVYVGAVAVLFLFVVMMLDIDFRELRRGFIKYLPIAGAVGVILLAQLIFVAVAWTTAPNAISPLTSTVNQATDNTRAIGQVLYTDYFYPFQISGLILLVAMIGAIVLTLRHKPDARRQNVARQLARQPKDVIEIRKIDGGKGVS